MAAKTDAHSKRLSAQYGISAGKAFLIAHLVEQDPAVRYTDAARLPINDINLLIASRYPDLQE